MGERESPLVARRRGGNSKVTRPATKAEWLDAIEREHSKLDRLLTPLTKRALNTPAITVGWPGRPTLVAVKDVLAHLTMWEKRMLAFIQKQTRGTAAKDSRLSMGASEFNALVYEENRKRALLGVQRDYRKTYATVLRTIRALPPAAITQLDAFGAIRFNTYGHYRWAIRKIRPWVRTQTGAGTPSSRKPSA